MRFFDFMGNPFIKEKEWYEVVESIGYEGDVKYSINLCSNKYYNNVKQLFAGTYDSIEEAKATLKKMRTAGRGITVEKIY